MLFLLVPAYLACVPDLLVDDFKKANLSALIIETPPPMRYFNLIGGDYGIKDGNITIDTSAQYMGLTSVWGPADTSESDTHPGAPTAHNYWYAKFDLHACYDITPYKAIQFDLVAPAGTEMTFGLTQKAPDCQNRLIDSVYKNLTEYVTPVCYHINTYEIPNANGTKKTVTMPLSDFAKNWVGQNFDFVHLKDFTVINIQCGNTGPCTTPLQLSNFILKGDCPAGGSSTTGSATGPTGSATTSPASTAKNSAWVEYPSMALLSLLALF